MKINSESDEEFDGKRIRTYSFDPAKYDNDDDGSDWKLSSDNKPKAYE